MKDTEENSSQGGTLGAECFSIFSTLSSFISKYYISVFFFFWFLIILWVHALCLFILEENKQHNIKS